MPTGWMLIALHAISAAAFFFALQYFAMGASPSTSALWAVVAAWMAAGLAWLQNKRNSGK